MCLGMVGVLTRVWDEGGTLAGHVDSGTSTQQVSLLACPHAQVGASVLVHSGFVLEVLEADAAQEARRLRGLAGDSVAGTRTAGGCAAGGDAAGDCAAGDCAAGDC